MTFQNALETTTTTTVAKADSPSLEEIQIWLENKVTEELDLDEEIDWQTPLADCGLSSMVAVSLSGDLEEWLNIQLPVTILWDYPSIEELGVYLKSQL